MIAVKVQSQALNELAEQAKEIGREKEVAMVGAHAVANLVREYLFKLDGERPNALGGPRTHFYANAAKSVQEPEQDGNGASFEITQIGLAQRLLGGKITPGKGTSSATGEPTKWIAIPARAEAYGKTPGEFDDLQFIAEKNGGAMLIQAAQSVLAISRKKKDGTRTIKGRETGGLVMFWLVKEVDQEADPTVLPTESEMLQQARLNMEEHLVNLLKTE